MNIYSLRGMQNGEEKKVVLAYSGGLDTSVAIKWLQEKNYDIIALCLDLGEGKDLAFVKEKGTFSRCN